MSEADPARVLQAARDFAQTHIRSAATAWARGEGSPRAMFALAAQAGLLGIEVPQSAGGLGLRFSCKAQIAEVLAAADFGFAMAWVNTHNVAHHLARVASPRLVGQWVPSLLAGTRVGCTALTEPAVGSDFAAITTTARAVDGGWELQGTKSWIVNAAHADVMVVYAQTQAGSGAAGIAAFLVDASRAEFERTGAEASDAARAIQSGGFRLAGYRCRDDEQLHPAGEAFKAAMGSINAARTYVAAMCCGIVADALATASAYGLERQTFGMPLHDHQGWRWSLADAAVDLEAARALVQAACALIDAGGDAQDLSAKAKVFATRMAARHVPALLHAMGAEGLREERAFMRHLGAAQVAALVDGSTEMLLERIARGLRKASSR